MKRDQEISDIGNLLGDVLFTAFDKFIKNQKSDGERYQNKGIKINQIDFDGYVAAILFFIKNVAACFSISLEDFVNLLSINLEGIQFSYEADTPGHFTLN